MRPDSPPSTEQSADSAAFADAKAEILAETPSGWRARVFHPAWTVAAGIFLVSAILIHVSPRWNAGLGNTMPPRPFRADRTPLGVRPEIRERLPESRPIPPAPPPSPQTDRHLLIEAEAALAPEAIPAGAEITLIAPFPEPPRLVDRPRPLDAGKLAVDIAVLAGMQIGARDWDDAGRTIGMLRRYLPEKAEELEGALAGARSSAPLPSAGPDIDPNPEGQPPAQSTDARLVETDRPPAAESHAETPAGGAGPTEQSAVQPPVDDPPGSGRQDFFPAIATPASLEAANPDPESGAEHLSLPERQPEPPELKEPPGAVQKEGARAENASPDARGLEAKPPEAQTDVSETAPPQRSEAVRPEEQGSPEAPPPQREAPLSPEEIAAWEAAVLPAPAVDSLPLLPNEPFFRTGHSLFREGRTRRPFTTDPYIRDY